jgi:hypothetical protein
VLINIFTSRRVGSVVEGREDVLGELCVLVNHHFDHVGGGLVAVQVLQGAVVAVEAKDLGAQKAHVLDGGSIAAAGRGSR